MPEDFIEHRPVKRFTDPDEAFPHQRGKRVIDVLDKWHKKRWSELSLLHLRQFGGNSDLLSVL